MTSPYTSDDFQKGDKISCVVSGDFITAKVVDSFFEDDEYVLRVVPKHEKQEYEIIWGEGHPQMTWYILNTYPLLYYPVEEFKKL